jgi:hypothetical protein
VELDITGHDVKDVRDLDSGNGIDIPQICPFV